MTNPALLDMAPMTSMPATSVPNFGPSLLQQFTEQSATPSSDPPSNLPMWRHLAGHFWLAGREIRWPLQANMTIEDGEFFATEPKTGIYGVGHTVAESLDDLRHALTGHRDALMKSERLAPDLEKQLRILQHHLQPA